jgi:hypothetical protein
MHAASKREGSSIAPITLGMGIGAVIAIASILGYIAILREPGPWFYPFAGLLFFGGPVIGGLTTASKVRERRIIASLVVSGAVFVLAAILFVLVYAILPQFARTTVQLPASCDGFHGDFSPPAHLTYTLPGMGTGILLASDERSAVVAVIEYHRAPSPSTVFLVNRGDNTILRSMRFANDVVVATVDHGVVYLYNDKLGYSLNASTGESEKNVLLIDNYGGLSEADRPILPRASDGHWYLETTAVISSWGVDGTVRSRPFLTLNGIARGCFIAGATGEVTRLSK